MDANVLIEYSLPVVGDWGFRTRLALALGSCWETVFQISQVAAAIRLYNSQSSSGILFWSSHLADLGRWLL